MVVKMSVILRARSFLGLKPFVSPEWPETVPDLESFDILYWAGNIRGRSRLGMVNRTGPKME